MKAPSQLAQRVASAARLVARVWIVLGAALLLTWLLDQALLRIVPDPHRALQHDPSMRKPAKRKTDVFRDVAWSRDYWREHEASKPMRWDHYGLWRRREFAGVHINIDARGLRATVNPDPGEDAIRIFVFGGSTVWSTGARDLGTLPSQLSAALNEAGVAVEVTNFGEAGYVISQERMALERELRNGAVPALAVFYDGVNDTYSALQNGEAGLPVNERRRVREFNLSLGGTRLLTAWLSQFPGALRLHSYIDLRRDPPELDAEALGREVVDHYLWNVERIRELGDRFGFALRFYWQPVLFTKRQLSESESANFGRSDRRLIELQLAVARLVAERPDLAAAEDFTDLSTVLDGEPGPLFMDHCHISEHGNALVAGAMAEDLLSSERLAPLLGALPPPRG